MGSAVHSVRVVIADDQPMVRATFSALLNASPGIAVVGEATNGAEAIHLALATHPDVVLMDVMMPTLDGMQATRQLLAVHDSVGGLRPRVLMLSETGGDQYVYEALRDGARGFLPKSVAPAELAVAVHVAASDEGLVSPAETVRLIAEYTPDHGDRPELGRRRAALSTGDAIVVAGVAHGHDDRQIAENLGIAPSEVARRVRSLLDLLVLRDRTQLVVFAYESGLVGHRRGARGMRPQASADSVSN